MSKTGSAAKVKLNSFDDLFGTEQPQTGTEQVQEIALSELHEFKGHPFKVLDDEKMQETVESVREHGVLMPGIARPMKDGGYEIIAGHRRRHACELVGLTTMPMFIRDYTDDEATIIMVDSNIQREDILPSEKAKAYRMKYDAMKHQGSKEGGLTLGELGEAAGESAKTVQRYIYGFHACRIRYSIWWMQRKSVSCRRLTYHFYQRMHSNGFWLQYRKQMLLSQLSRVPCSRKVTKKGNLPFRWFA